MYLHMVCVADPCLEHRHRWHHGRGHCVSCYEDGEESSNQGYTFDSRKASWRSQEHCCCRDERIGAIGIIPESIQASITGYYLRQSPFRR